MGDVIKFPRAARAVENMIDVPLDQQLSIFKSELTSMCVGAEMCDVPRASILEALVEKREHLNWVIARVEESLTPEAQAKEKAMTGG